MSSLQEHLSKFCCCIHIETGGYVVGLTRLVLHTIRVIIAIVLLTGGISKGSAVTEAPSGCGDSTTEGSPMEGSSTTKATTIPMSPAFFSSNLDDGQVYPFGKASLSTDDMQIMEPCKKVK
jgi:hypothetical protein